MNVEVAHKLSEHASSDRHKRRREEVFEILEVLVLSIAAIATAWTGYQAARGDGAQSVLYGEATRDRFAADAAATVGRAAAGGGLGHVQRLAPGQGRQRPAAPGGVRPPLHPRLPQRLCRLVEDWAVHQPVAAPAGPAYMAQYRNLQLEQAKRLKTTRPRRRSPRGQRRARPRTSTSAATVGATVIDVPRRTGLVRLSDRSPLAQAVLPASCLEKYWRAVLVCCLPVKSTPRAVRNPLDSAATWNAWLGGHLVDSSRIREPSG